MEKIVFDFNTEPSIRTWAIINDGVMGGVSGSQMEWSPGGYGVFSGFVSLENNGGFASTRTYPQDFELGGYQGLLIRVKGDGKKYSFRIRTDANFDGVNYSTDFFAPLDEWVEIRLPFGGFQPTFRGRILTNVKPVDSGEIRQLGFLISDKQEGPFILKIDWIKAY